MTVTPPPKPRLSADERRRQIVEIAVRSSLGRATSGPRRRRSPGWPASRTPTCSACSGRRRTSSSRAPCGPASGRSRRSARRPRAGRPSAPSRRSSTRWASPTSRMLEDRELLQLQMQLWAACSDPDIRAVAREHYGAVIEEVHRLSGADPDTLRAFVSRGMLLNVAAAMSLDDLAGRSHGCRASPAPSPGRSRDAMTALARLALRRTRRLLSSAPPVPVAAAPRRARGRRAERRGRRLPGPASEASPATTASSRPPAVAATSGSSAFWVAGPGARRPGAQARLRALQRDLAADPGVDRTVSWLTRATRPSCRATAPRPSWRPRSRTAPTSSRSSTGCASATATTA